ncbi:putative uncharacterized protein [Firmicutes bacterium CAG:227]|nr:putative uncharacterized protein [Firmicutes bacterium CAG:227]
MKKPQMKEETRKKIDNFWYYYKIHVLVVVFILFVASVFIKDIVTKVDYDYSVAFVTEEMMTNEEISSIQSVFEGEAEDLNGDGEIHVEVQNYTIPQGDSADPQLVAAGQTKLTVDIQEGTSMIFFLSPGCYESYKDSGVLPADESEYIKFSDCTGYEEAGSPKELGDLMGALRLVEDTKLKKDQNKMDYYEANKELFEKFTEKTLRGE